MARLAATIAGIALALSIASPVAAKAKRAVVLLDFSQPTPSPTVTDPVPQVSEGLSAVSRAMASQFTGAPMDRANPAPGVLLPPAGLGLRTLGNPFLAYSVATRPITPLFDTPTTLAHDACAAPTYQATFGFGRAAEDRRRTIFPLIHQAACEFGLPVGLFDALIMQESRYQPAAVSPKGAFGLAQLMPGTARQLGVDPYSLRDNIRGGARYLKQQVDRFGRFDLALAAYNAGPGRVERRRQVPQIAETKAYVRTIMSNWTGIAPEVKSAPRPASYRQAQMIFMPHLTTRF
jgi:soluble lytic murein transglycosylase-like protein